MTASQERTVFQSVALAVSNHHHLFDDHFRLPGTLELDRACVSLGRTAASVTLADTAVLHLVFLDALALVHLDSTRYAIFPCRSALPTTSASARLHPPHQHNIIDLTPKQTYK